MANNEELNFEFVRNVWALTITMTSKGSLIFP